MAEVSTWTLKGDALVYGRPEQPKKITVGGASVLLDRGEPPHPNPDPETLNPGDSVVVDEVVTLTSLHNAHVTVEDLEWKEDDESRS